jgi:hypothetical protein
VSRALVAAVLTLLAVAAPASADTTIAFDDHGGELSDQYAAQGVSFGHVPDGRPEGRDYILATSGARSSPNAVRLCGSEEVCFPQMWGDFSAPHHHLSAYVGTYPSSPSSGTTQNTVLTAYDLSGNPVAEDYAYVPNGGQIRSKLSVDASAEIWFFSIAPANGNNTKETYVDDLSFDAPPAGAAPDFGLASSTNSNELQMSAGDTIVSQLVLRRVNGSSGPISLDVSGLPRGVSASLSPNPVDGPDGTHITLTLTSAADAPGAAYYPVRITGTPASSAAGAVSRSVQITLTVGGAVTGFDIRLKGIEPTQGIQSGFLLSGPNANGSDYLGVPLAEGGKTLVRVYADALRVPSGGITGVSVQLTGRDAAGRALPGGPLMPVGVPPSLGPKPYATVGVDDRDDPSGSYTFLLPPAWTHGDITLRAEALPPPDPVFHGDTSYVECLDRGCRENNAYEIRHVHFHPTRTYTLDVLELRTANSLQPFPPLDQVFDVPLALVPTGEGQFVLRGPRYVVEHHDKDLNQQVSNWYHDNGRPGDAAMGVEVLPAGGGGGQTWMDDHTAIASSGRPFSALSHELFHLLGRQHASAACGGGDPAKPEGFEAWPPDGLGYLHGIAVDRRDPTLHNRFSVIGAGAGGFTDAYDIMSYCAGANHGEYSQWVSPSNWTAVLDFLAGSHRLQVDGRVAASPAPRLRVTASVADAARIDSVQRVTRTTSIPGAPTAYHLIARGASGQTLADAVMSGQAVHAEPAGRRLVLTGEVPAAGAEQVDVVANGTVVASRHRSPHAPSLRLLSPRRGSHVRGRQFTVRWRARDADGDPIAERIDYSLDGGRTWSGIGENAGAQSMRLPASLFARSGNARLRIVADDGFNETRAVSGRFRADGRPPTVRIADLHGPVASFPADATVTFDATASDDRFRRLRGLRWFDGRRLIGRGETIALTGALALGRRHIRVVARDGLGRTGSDSVIVRVLPATPRFLVLTGPARASRRATRVTLRVASSLPARLFVRGHRFAVGRRPRRIGVPVAPGKTTLTLSLQLRSGARRALSTLEIPRP